MDASFLEGRDQPPAPVGVPRPLLIDVGVVAERGGRGGLDRAGDHQAGVLANLAEIGDEVGVAGDEPGPESGHVRPFRQGVHGEDAVRRT